MAALAAEKLNLQKLNGDFQSDSNLAEPLKRTNSSKARLAFGPKRRIMLKVHK